MARVNWTARALSALDEIYDYINRDAPLYAERFVQQIFDSVDRLEDFPLSGRPVTEAERDDIREVLCRSYRIIYWFINEEQLDIIGVIHGSRDLTLPDNQPWEVH